MQGRKACLFVPSVHVIYIRVRKGMQYVSVTRLHLVPHYSLITNTKTNNTMMTIPINPQLQPSCWTRFRNVSNRVRALTRLSSVESSAIAVSSRRSECRVSSWLICIARAFCRETARESTSKSESCSGRVGEVVQVISFDGLAHSICSFARLPDIICSCNAIIPGLSTPAVSTSLPSFILT